MPIVKLLTHKRPSYKKLLEYITAESSRLYDESGRSFLITHNMRCRSIEKWTEQLKANEQRRVRKRRKNGIYLYHEVLSWSPLDTPNLTIEKLQTLVRQYMKLRNPNGIYVAVPHFAKHVHVHICASAVDRDGKSMRLSREALRNLKEDFYQFQQRQYPEICHSPNNTRVRTIRNKKRNLLTYKPVLTSQREAVRTIVQECHAKSKSQEEFYRQLAKQGLQTYKRGGKVYGVIANGRKYRFKNLDTPLTKYPDTSKRRQEIQITRSKSVDLNQSLEC